MKKSGGFALVCYIIYTIVSVGSLIYNRVGVDVGDGWDVLGYAILMVLSFVMVIPSVAGLIFKLLQMASGWGFFGFLCILVDLSFIIFIGYALTDFALDTFLVLSPMFVMSIASLVSNVKALKN